MVAASILDRLINTAVNIAVNGRSYRPNKRPGGRQRPAKEPTTD
ncbi:MAG: hypothetical protein ACKVWR_01840 [Acidimicrobiales bacterium]